MKNATATKASAFLPQAAVGGGGYSTTVTGDAVGHPSRHQPLPNLSTEASTQLLKQPVLPEVA